jgi:hypothetical protein
MPREKPIVAALNGIERSLTRLEDKIEQLITAVVEGSNGSEEFRQGVIKDVSAHGKQLRQQEELVLKHEADYQRRHPARSDAE